MSHVRDIRSSGALAVLIGAALAAFVFPGHLSAQAASGATGREPLRLSIDSAVELALSQGDEVRLARAQVDLSDAQIVTARAAGLPALRVTGAYNQAVANARAAIVGSVFGQKYTYQTTANLSQPLFQGGRVFAGMRAASRLRESSRLSEQEVRSQASVDVQRAYLGVLLADQLVDIQQRNLALSDARLAQVQELEKGGRAARYDVLRARVERANLEPLLIQARSNRELALLELKGQLNIPPDQPVQLTSTLDDSVAVAAVRKAVQDSAVTAMRPGVRAAEFLVDARREGIRVARADYLPTVSAFLQGGLLALPTTAGFPTRLGESSAALCPAGSPTTRVCQNNGFFADKSFGMNLSWNLFDGLRTKGNVDLARANLQIAQLQLSQEQERVQLDVARARSELARAKSAYETQRQNVQEAEEAFNLANLRFQRGIGTQLDVSDAQLALLTARTNAARSTVDAYLAAADLARALGRPVPMPGAR